MATTIQDVRDPDSETSIFYREKPVSRKTIHAKIDEYCEGKSLKQLRNLKNRIVDKKDLASTTVIPVASGKGGVGKTNMVISLALALHDYEWDVGIVDLDLTSNTHCLLGLQEDDIMFTLLDYLEDTEVGLDQIFHPVYPNTPHLADSYDGVHFFPGLAAGDDRSREQSRMINYQQYRKLLRGLLRLDSYDFLLLDLPAGSSTTALTFFSPQQAETSDLNNMMSRSRLKRLMVLNYTPSSFEASRVFLDHAISRELKKRFSDHETVRKLMDQFKDILKSRMSSRRDADDVDQLAGNYRFEILKKAAKADPEFETMFQDYLENFSTGVLCNAFGNSVEQARKRFFGEDDPGENQREHYEKLSPRDFKNYFLDKYSYGHRSIEPAFIGYCPRESELVEESELRGRSFYVQDPSSELSMQIRKIAMQLQEQTKSEDETVEEEEEFVSTVVDRIDEHITEGLEENGNGVME